MDRSTYGVGSDVLAYRAYVIGHDERIQSAVSIDAETDEDAIVAAQAMVDGHAIELWDRGRKIIRFEAKS